MQQRVWIDETVKKNKVNKIKGRINWNTLRNDFIQAGSELCSRRGERLKYLVLISKSLLKVPHGAYLETNTVCDHIWCFLSKMHCVCPWGLMKNLLNTFSFLLKHLDNVFSQYFTIRDHFWVIAASCIAQMNLYIVVCVPAEQNWDLLIETHCSVVL